MEDVSYLAALVAGVLSFVSPCVLPLVPGYLSFISGVSLDNAHTGTALPEGWTEGEPLILETTLGRALFNETLPSDYAFVNYEVGKKQLGVIVNDLAERYTKVEVAASLDALKETGFHWATRSGVTVSIEDVVTPASKAQILGGYEKQAEKVQKQFERGLVTDEERRQEIGRASCRERVFRVV